MLSYAILIDGGFLKRKLGKPSSQAGIVHIREFLENLKSNALLSAMRLHRIYFYDSQPFSDTEEKPLSGGKVDFGAHPAFSRNKKLHAELIHEPFLALRLGELSFRGWSVSQRSLNTSDKALTITEADLRPDIQQKGVDMRIGLDIAALTLKKQADVIVLVTGDSDFIPAMKFARREGAQLFLVPMGHSIKDGMREHADLILSM